MASIATNQSRDNQVSPTFTKMDPNSSAMTIDEYDKSSSLQPSIATHSNFKDSNNRNSSSIEDSNGNNNILNSVHPLYSATYSGTKVIEMCINDVCLMRRKTDSSFNATSILKLAGLDKTRRTKLLEREIHTGIHEKIQGGYGKYQGTWVPYDRAISLCQQYGLYELMKPLLLFNVYDSAKLPTKEEAAAISRKNKEMDDVSLSNPGSFYNSNLNNLPRSYSSMTENDEENNINSQTQTQTDSNTKTQVEMQNQKENDRSKSNGNTNEKEGGITNEVKNENDESRNPNGNKNVIENRNEDDEMLESPAKKAKTNGSIINFEIFNHDLKSNLNSPYTLEPLSKESLPTYEPSKELITQIFLSNSSDLTALLENNSSNDINLDVPIDELGHTALHWASTLARIPLVKQLIQHGANRYRGNNDGETPLVRAILVTNNMENSSFHELLNYLYPCITNLDHQDRTILHHIALTAGIKGRSGASRYYLETLLEWIVKKGYLMNNCISLSGFMKDIVNLKDKNGDTCLNIAARIGNRAIVQQLLDVGADPWISNRAGLRANDFGILNQNNNQTHNGNSLIHADRDNLVDPSNENNNSKVENKSSTKILESMQQMLNRLNNDFQNEISAKQKSINAIHLKLRESTLKLSESRKILENLKTNQLNLISLKQKISNIEKSINEEEIKFSEETSNKYGAIENFDVDFDADEPFRVESVYKEFEKRIRMKINQLDDDMELNLQDFSSNLNLLSEIDLDNINISEHEYPTSILKARIKSYQENESNLVNYLSLLNSKSSNLENKFRHVVSLCTGVDEARVDDLLEGLVQAVESDPDEVDIGRVAGFLRKVDDSIDV